MAALKNSGELPAGFQGIFFEFGQKKACPPIEKDGGS
jgi:hypothetical protein